jgi:hypothetical protein
MGSSVSTSSSEQSAQAFIAQQFSGSCNITCTNIAQGINIDLINTVVGGSLELTQSCSVDANCLISGTSDATSDVLFKATNSTNAKNAGNVFSGDLFNFDYASSASRQDIKQRIVQSTTQTCKMASLNQLDNLSILAVNSQIGGNIAIGQTGSTSGQCQLTNNLSAAASATAMASNTATSGKDKKGSKKGGSGVIIGIFAILGLAVVTYIVAKLYTSSRDTAATNKRNNAINIEKAKAGCLGGGKAVLDTKTGLPLLDEFGKAICPPPNLSAAQKLEISLTGGEGNIMKEALQK